MIACMLLSGCGPANATNLESTDLVQVDSTNDVHCSVLAFYFNGLAEHRSAPRNQIRATKVVHEWYGAKMRRVAVERWDNWAEFAKETEPVLEAVKSDPAAMRDELLACTDRAIAEPGFEKFASELGE